MIQTLNVSNAPNQSLTAQLTVNGSGLILQLSLSYNVMAGYWVMSIADTNGNPILSSVPLLTGVYPAANILAPYQYFFIGSAYIINLSGVVVDHPNDFDLGTDFTMWWGDQACYGSGCPQAVLSPIFPPGMTACNAGPIGPTGPQGIQGIPGVANIGGAEPKTTDYVSSTPDDGYLISFSGSTGKSLSLPAVPPSAKWKILTEDVGSGPLYINPILSTYPIGFTPRMIGSNVDGIITFDRVGAASTTYTASFGVVGTQAVFGTIVVLKPSGTPAFAQANYATSASVSTTSFTCSFNVANVSGNCLVVDIYITNATATPTVGISDTLSNAYTLYAGGNASGGNGHFYTYAAPNCGAGFNTITFTSTGTITDFVIAAHEYSGIVTSSPLDSNSATWQYTGSSPISMSVTTTVANELLHCFCAANPFNASGPSLNWSYGTVQLVAGQGAYITTDGINYYYAEFSNSTGGSSSPTSLTQSFISSTPYAVQPADEVLTFVSGASTVNLPALSAIQRHVIILLNRSGSTLTLNPNGSDTIQGLSAYYLYNGGYYQIVPNA